MRAMDLVRQLVVIPIVVYRRIISPLTPSTCIYTPTCSAYAHAAILRHGVLRGAALALARLGRCVGALYVGGEDPVPMEVTFRSLVSGYRKFFRRRGGDESRDTPVEGPPEGGERKWL